MVVGIILHSFLMIVWIAFSWTKIHSGSTVADKQVRSVRNGRGYLRCRSQLSLPGTRGACAAITPSVQLRCCCTAVVAADTLFNCWRHCRNKHLRDIAVTWWASESRNKCFVELNYCVLLIVWLTRTFDDMAVKFMFTGFGFYIHDFEWHEIKCHWIE